MVIVFPLAMSDRDHASAQLKLLKAFGPYLEDRALILPTPPAMHDPVLREHIQGLSALFAPESVKVVETPNDWGGNWSYNSGCHFKFAIETMNRIKWDDLPFIWMEADLQPIIPNWLSIVKNDYVMGKTPFRGMIEKTRLEITNTQTGEVTPNYTGTEHFVGAGIYPAGYIRYTVPTGNPKIKGSPMASYRNPSYSIPFDVKCEGQHIPATQSPVWLHKPRTVNWKHEEGSIYSCEDRSVDRFGLTYAGKVSLSGVALVHGPKDHSLANAVLGATSPVQSEVNYIPSVDRGLAMIEQPEYSTPAATIPTFAPPSPPSQDEQLMARIREMEEKMSDLKEDLDTQIANNVELARQLNSALEEIKKRESVIETMREAIADSAKDVVQVQSTEAKQPKKPVNKKTPPKKKPASMVVA